MSRLVKRKKEQAKIVAARTEASILTSKKPKKAKEVKEVTKPVKTNEV